VDRSSPKLMLSCCDGTHFADALLTVRKAGGNPVEYIKIKLETVMITGLSTGGSLGDDRLTENLILNFAKVSVDGANLCDIKFSIELLVVKFLVIQSLALEFCDGVDGIWAHVQKQPSANL
jgi:hypothetical protein